mmetsp:Transcript_10491/g.31335  ORF Transcript_10491/g.31335 Transcript_10491/m.31335 type:complete len:164 (+) Transcript_10491:115-606(+)
MVATRAQRRQKAHSSAGALKWTLPAVGGAVALINMCLIVGLLTDPKSLAIGAKVGGGASSNLDAALILNKCSAWAALGFLGVASWYRGAETRFRVGIALAAVLVASIYADYALAYVYVIDTKVRNPAERSRFVLKAALTVPLVLALAAHLKEPGFLTADKKDQ